MPGHSRACGRRDHKGSHIAAALALGAQGVWCRTIWLGTRESELTPIEKEALFAARAEDTLRSKVRTGKAVRMLRSCMTDAWEQPDAPSYLDTPLQGILYNEIHARILRSQRKELISIPAGQSVVDVVQETSVREVMLRMQAEYLDAMDRLSRIEADA